MCAAVWDALKLGPELEVRDNLTLHFVAHVFGAPDDRASDKTC